MGSGTSASERIRPAEKQTSQIRVLLANDLALIRNGIRALLMTVHDVDIVAEVGNAEEVIPVARESGAQVVLMDQDMPGEPLRTTRALKEALPEVEVIVMTDRLDDVKALQAIEAGATGYILMDIPIENLAAALRSVCNGRAFFHPQITRKLMDRLGHLTREARTRRLLETEGLTARELDILLELAKGSTDREIATKFVVAEGTVKTHLRHILRKLGARNRTQAVAYVLRKGLID